nr:reverse transcriptase domain-containing protein [Tanacetum cinerariifolium]
MEHLNFKEISSSLEKWIKEFHLPDGLRVPSHVGYYDGKGDPDDFIHDFEGAIKMEKWVMSAEETALEGRPITFIDGGIEEKPPKGKP